MLVVHIRYVKAILSQIHDRQLDVMPVLELSVTRASAIAISRRNDSSTAWKKDVWPGTFVQ